MESTNTYAGTDTPPTVRWTQRLESATALDWPVRVVRPVAEALVSDPARRDALHGKWLGHALHPVLTDLPIGFWTSAVVLDLLGGRQSRPAAARLLGLGVVSAVPAMVTGYAEWAEAGQREKRVGVVHAASNAAALALFACSLDARRKGRHARGVLLGLAGSAAVTFGGYLGGHLTSARKVSTRHPAFDD